MNKILIVKEKCFRHLCTRIIFPTLFSAVLAIGSMLVVVRMLKSYPGSVAALRSRFPRAQRTLEQKFYFDELYQWAIDRLVLALAGLVGWFDRRVLTDLNPLLIWAPVAGFTFYTSSMGALGAMYSQLRSVH